MSLYPKIEQSQPDQQFTLGKIRDLDSFLSKEAEDRRKVQKKYLWAVNIAHGVSTGVGLVGVGLEAAGIPMVATGIETLPGIVLSALGAGAFGINMVCDAIIWWYKKKGYEAC